MLKVVEERDAGKKQAEGMEDVVGATLDELAREGARRMRSVAEAAGGFLGLGSKVSSTEEAVVAEIAAAFKGAAEQTRS